MSSPSAKLTIQIDKMVRNLQKVNNDIFSSFAKYFNNELMRDLGNLKGGSRENKLRRRRGKKPY